MDGYAAVSSPARPPVRWLHTRSSRPGPAGMIVALLSLAARRGCSPNEGQQILIEALHPLVRGRLQPSQAS